MQQFETTDFYLACFLRCRGFDLTDVRRTGRRSTFVFSDSAQRRAEVLAFYRSKAVVAALDFVAAIKEMKSLIHNL